MLIVWDRSLFWLLGSLLFLLFSSGFSFLPLLGVPSQPLLQRLNQYRSTRLQLQFLIFVNLLLSTGLIGYMSSIQQIVLGIKFLSKILPSSGTIRMFTINAH